MVLCYVPESTKRCSFANDATFSACDKDLNSLVNRSEHDNYLTNEWFENNSKKINQGLFN